MSPHHQLLTTLNSLYKKGDCEEAIQVFKDFIENSVPDNEDQAEEIFLDVIAMTKLWPDNEESRHCCLIRGLALQKLEQYDKAVREFEHAIKCS